MIDRTATIEKYGYDPDALSRGSVRRVVRVCDGCGEVRDVVFQSCGNLCKSCAKRNMSEETKKKMSDAKRGKCFGEKNNFYGKKHSIDTRKKYSEMRRGEKHPMYGVHRHGADNPNWKGGITPIREQMWRSQVYKNWRKAVFERDNYTCQMCNRRGGDMQAHHVRPIRDNINTLLIFDIDNGITLCIECHREVNGHEEEFESFFDNKIKEVK